MVFAFHGVLIYGGDNQIVDPRTRYGNSWLTITCCRSGYHKAEYHKAASLIIGGYQMLVFIGEDPPPGCPWSRRNLSQQSNAATHAMSPNPSTPISP